MEKYLVLATFVGSVIALLFALFTGKRVLRFEEGTPLMSKISRSIREGANAYLRRQYTVVGIFFACMIVVLCIMAACKLLTWFVPFAFLTGGFFSGLSGFVGMRIATKANCRTANACRDGLNKGLRVAFSAGSVMGFTVVGLGLFDISVWFMLLRFVFKLEAADITSAMLTFGMGASSMALFARVGGGIFTKAADVGADLVGKVEAGIPEDDPRNPAVIRQRGRQCGRCGRYGRRPVRVLCRLHHLRLRAGRGRLLRSGLQGHGHPHGHGGGGHPLLHHRLLLRQDRGERRPAHPAEGAVPGHQPVRHPHCHHFVLPGLGHAGSGALGPVCGHPVRPGGRCAHRQGHGVLHLRHL